MGIIHVFISQLANIGEINIFRSREEGYQRGSFLYACSIVTGPKLASDTGNSGVYRVSMRS